MAKLLPKQIEQLKLSREILIKKRKEYVDACNDFDKLASISWEGVTDLNSIYDADQIAIIDSRICMIDKILKESTLITPTINTNKIEIGSFFKATLDDEEDVYQLVEQLTKVDGDYIQVSIQSPFGKSVYQKEEGDTFSYKMKSKIPGEIITFEGVIDKIYGFTIEKEKSR